MKLPPGTITPRNRSKSHSLVQSCGEGTRPETGSFAANRCNARDACVRQVVPARMRNSLQVDMRGVDDAAGDLRRQRHQHQQRRQVIAVSQVSRRQTPFRLLRQHCRRIRGDPEMKRPTPDRSRRDSTDDAYQRASRGCEKTEAFHPPCRPYPADPSLYHKEAFQLPASSNHSFTGSSITSTISPWIPGRM